MGLMVERIARVQALAAEAEMDALALMPGPNMVYFTGLSFHLSERPTVAFFPVVGPAFFIVPAFEAIKLEGLPFEARAFTYDDFAGPRAAFEQAVAALNRYRRAGDGADEPLSLGIEGRRMRFLELDLMSRTGHGPRVLDADAAFAELRMRKDAGELARMREAVAIAERALAATLPMVRAGTREKAIAAELVLQTFRAGSGTDLPFTPIVAAGANGASPHAFPTDYVLRPGDLVTIDWGAAAGRYFADITRTYAIAGAPVHPDLVQAYEAVRAANAAGRATVRPGATGQDVDRAARKAIEDAGLGQYFTHRTGHGLGLEGHEEPDMKEGSLMPLAPGMTFTVEPGVYIPGLGGVRIEDDMVVTAEGGESLTTLGRELVAVG